MAQPRWRGPWWEGCAEPYWGARSAEPYWGARSAEPYWGTRDADDTNVWAEGNREAEAARSAVAEEAVDCSRLWWTLDADEADALAAAEWRREADIACSVDEDVAEDADARTGRSSVPASSSGHAPKSEAGHFEAAQLWSSAPSPLTHMEKLMQKLMQE